MGQYWYVVNLDKKEFVNPHKLGTGLKLWEQLANHPGTGAALIILCAAMPETRGGGDLDLEKNWHGPERKFPEHNACPGPMPENYQAIAARTIGRWSGDRIALVGDYAKDTDLKRKPGDPKASKIYHKCQSEEREVFSDDPKGAAYKVGSGPHAGQYLHYEEVKPPEFKDVSEDVARVIEHELQGQYSGSGWRNWKSSEAEGE